MNWRDSARSVAKLKKGVEQYEVATLVYGRDFSWSGPFNERTEADKLCEELTTNSMKSQVLVIPEDTK